MRLNPRFGLVRHQKLGIRLPACSCTAEKASLSHLSVPLHWTVPYALSLRPMTTSAGHFCDASRIEVKAFGTVAHMLDMHF